MSLNHPLNHSPFHHPHAESYLRNWLGAKNAGTIRFKVFRRICTGSTQYTILYIDSSILRFLTGVGGILKLMFLGQMSKGQIIINLRDWVWGQGIEAHFLKDVKWFNIICQKFALLAFLFYVCQTSTMVCSFCQACFFLRNVRVCFCFEPTLGLTCGHGFTLLTLRLSPPGSGTLKGAHQLGQEPASANMGLLKCSRPGLTRQSARPSG